MRFKIPTDYDRKWNSIGFENGVLKITYEKDLDELPMKKN
jgi:HSP20 family molecular chaperone IbpA